MNNHRSIVYLLCCLIAGVLSSFLYCFTGPTPIDHLLYAYNFPVRAPPDPRIVIVEIDAASAAHYGDAMRDRIFFADVVTALNQFSPKVIAIDVLFEDRSSPDGDAAFAKTASTAGNVILATRAQNIGHGKIILPYEELTDSAKSMGPASIAFSHNGRVDSIILWKDGRRSHFVQRILSDYLGSPYRSQRDFPICYIGDEAAFLHLSVLDLLERRGDGSILKDAIVMVGVTSAPLIDHFYTPLSKGRIADTAGVVIWANAIHTALNGRFIINYESLDIFGGLLSAVLLGLLIMRMSFAKAASTLAFALVFYIVLFKMLFAYTLCHVNATPVFYSAIFVALIHAVFWAGPGRRENMPE